MRHIAIALLFASLTAGGAVAAPLTPFEGAWAPSEQPAGCDNAGITGDGFTVEKNVIGSGDTVCTIRHVDRRGESFFLRLHCHGLNRSMAGTHYARIDRLSRDRIRFRHRGQPPSEMRRCK